MSAPALNIAKLLPTSTDPCGRTTFGVRTVDDEHFGVAKMDYQLSAYPLPLRSTWAYARKHRCLIPSATICWRRAPVADGFDDFVQSFTIGETNLDPRRASSTHSVPRWTDPPLPATVRSSSVPTPIRDQHLHLPPQVHQRDRQPRDSPLKQPDYGRHLQNDDFSGGR